MLVLVHVYVALTLALSLPHVNLMEGVLLLPTFCLADDGHVPCRWIRLAVHSLAHGHSFALSNAGIARAVLLGWKSLTVVGFRFFGLVMDRRDPVLQSGMQFRWMLNFHTR